MNVVLLLVLLTLAAARVTRLLVADAFPPVAQARAWFGARGDWQDYLSKCPWCMGVWVAGAFTFGAEAWYGLPAPLLVWPTVAYGAGLLVWAESQVED